ncbi:hypothetical protein CGCTS75_v008733 [Colletotrichum tropicale]|nr:hypothetical protein CGCTS75_v008733 [Colletotrichum tropicale]
MAGHNRDVADLWKDALKAYKGIVGFDLERKFENLEVMITRGIKEMQNFHNFRHDDKKVDRLRGLFSANLDYIEKDTQQLGGAQKKMNLRIRRLQEATEFAILGNTEEIQKMTPELLKNQHSHTAMLEEQMQVMSVVRDTTESIRDDMTKLRRSFDDQNREQSKPRGSGEQRGKCSGAEHGNHPSAKGIQNTLMEVEGEDHEYHVLQETIVPDTCAWVFREPEWERWLNQRDPPNTVLAITGSPGTGKSHLAFSVYQALKSEEATKDSSGRSCVAQFYFREQNESLSSFTNGVISVINQVAEQSPELCESMYAEIVRDASQIDRGSSNDLLRKVLGVAFGSGSKGRLFLVFDGIDEIADKDFALFEHALKISMVYTARPDICIQGSSSDPPLKIEITREKQMDDLRTIIWACINSSNALKKFSRAVEQRIADKTEEIAPNQLYAEHLLARLNTLECEGAVLRSLEKPLLRTLYQLYDVTTAECFRRTESSSRELVSKLLQRISYSLRPIKLNEGLSLLRFWSNESDFDLEEIPEPFAKLLRIGDPDSGAETRAKIQSRGGWGTAIDEFENAQKASQSDGLYQDGKLAIKFRERSMRGFFREEPVAPNDGHRPRRPEAHRQMFLTCCNFIQPEHPSIMSADKGVQEYAVNYVLHHWRDIEAEHLNVEQHTEVMETLASLMLDQSSFARIQEEELKTTFYHDERFDDAFFDTLPSWAGLLPDVNVSLSTEAAEWWTPVAECPRDCLLQLAKSHVRMLQDAVDM